MLRALLLFLFLLLVPAMGKTGPLPRPERVPDPVQHCSEGRWGPRHCIRADRFAEDLCHQIEAEARLHRLPPGFLARLLWQESRFDPNAVSPMRARGIAQFIDSTARLRGLKDVLNPAEAVEKAAEYLGNLRDRYGNIGLAAIAYNGGEGRADGWTARNGGLAWETVDYVRIVTGLRAEEWRDDPPDPEAIARELRLDGDVPFGEACERLAERRRMSPLTTPSATSPWGVQVGYGRSEAEARRSYARLQDRCREAAPEDGLEMVRVNPRGRGRPSLVMARIGADDRGSAARLCDRIRSAGCVCAVYRN
jgi:hypothetical protein